jgi:excinuclease UvrABC helicase subunit UvrB
MPMSMSMRILLSYLDSTTKFEVTGKIHPNVISPEAIKQLRNNSPKAIVSILRGITGTGKTRHVPRHCQSR